MNIDYDIALTHIITRKKQTLIASLGVTIGVAIYLFMNSLSAGFTKYSRDEIFKNNAHLKVFKDDEYCKPLNKDTSTLNIIVNPQITTTTKNIINPNNLLTQIKQQNFITNAIAQVDLTVFYNMGKTQIKGSSSGVNILEYNAMFNNEKYLVGGSLSALQSNLNGIIIGKGIAEKLSLKLNSNVTVSSSYGVVKVLRVVGIFESGNGFNDNSKSYINIATAQQFLKEGPAYITTIYANTLNADIADTYAQQLQPITNYKVEDWKTTNADLLAGDKTRNAMMGAISLSILFIAAFGIYNILSSTIVQKINDIAILKAIGFSGKDVIRIFVSEALIMGLIGTLFGLVFAYVLIILMANIYMGGPVGYFPIYFKADLFIQSFILGMLLTLFAGYFPARKAANVDPVSILRK
jgi:lipoprotein-releasing system permease protein